MDKAERAELLLLALAALLLRGGERVRLIGAEGRPIASLDRLAATLARLPEGDGVPPEAPLPPTQEVGGGACAQDDPMEMEVAEVLSPPGLAHSAGAALPSVWTSSWPQAEPSGERGGVAASPGWLPLPATLAALPPPPSHTPVLPPHRSCCWTRPPLLWTPSRSTWCRRLWTS